MAKSKAYPGVSAVGEIVGLTITGVTDATREYGFVGEFSISRNNNSWSYDPDTSIMTVEGHAADLTQMPREHYKFYGDNDPAMGVICYSHTNLGLLFSSSHNGTAFIASNATSFALYKLTTYMHMAYKSGNTKGQSFLFSNLGSGYTGMSWSSTGETLVGKLCLKVGNDQALSDDEYVDADASYVRVAGDGGAAVLDTDPAISDGVADGQLLTIQGTHDVNTVQIADACNTALAGGAAVTLGANDIIELVWDSGESLWIERTRSNN